MCWMIVGWNYCCYHVIFSGTKSNVLDSKDAEGRQVRCEHYVYATTHHSVFIC